jgi:hypothetical protein
MVATTEIVHRCAKKVFHENGVMFDDAAIIRIIEGLVLTIEDALDGRFPQDQPPEIFAADLEHWALYCKLLNEIDKEIPVVATFGVWYTGQSRNAAC